MPALQSARPVPSAPRIHKPPQSDIWESHAARSVTHWGRSGAVISVSGELDASNSGQLADHVQRCTGYCEWVILDLHAVAFIGTTGFSALKAIAGRCTDTDVRVTTVPSAAVTRLLRICDPVGELPISMSVGDALAGVQPLRPAL